jgi:hypothetical protein
MLRGVLENLATWDVFWSLVEAIRTKLNFEEELRMLLKLQMRMLLRKTVDVRTRDWKARDVTDERSMVGGLLEPWFDASKSTSETEER